MARITDEDCVIQVPNRFELVVLAAQRAKQIAARSPITVERDNDKNTVVALREIAGPTINLENLRASLVDLHRQYVQTESHEEDLDEFLLSNHNSDDQINHDQHQLVLDDEPADSLINDSVINEDLTEDDLMETDLDENLDHSETDDHEDPLLNQDSDR